MIGDLRYWVVWFTECEQMFFMEKKFFFRFMTDMTTKWLNFVVHDQNFGNLSGRT